jgi:hypothetical protein
MKQTMRRNSQPEFIKNGSKNNLIIPSPKNIEINPTKIKLDSYRKKML